MRTVLKLNVLPRSGVAVLAVIFLITGCSQRNPVSDAVEKEVDSGGPKGRPIRLANIDPFKGARLICLVPESLTLGHVFREAGMKPIDRRLFRHRTPIESTTIIAVSDNIVRFVDVPWSDFGLISNESLGECIPATVAALVPVKDTASDNYYYKFGRLGERR